MTTHFRRSKGTALFLSVLVAFLQILPSASAVEGLELVNGTIQSSVPFTPDTQVVEDQIISSQDDVIITPDTVFDSTKNIVINSDKDVFITSGTHIYTTKNLTVNARNVVLAPDATVKADGEITFNAENVEGIDGLSPVTNTTNGNVSSINSNGSGNVITIDNADLNLKTLNTDQVITSQNNIIIDSGTVLDPSKNIVINTDKDVFIASGTNLATTKNLTINAGGKVIVAPDAQVKVDGDITITANIVEGLSPSTYTIGSGLNSLLNPIQANATINGTITITSVSALPHKPEVKLQTYSATGRSQFPGYGSFVPGADRNNFSYRYDVGAAPGATVDVVIAKDLISADLSGGLLKMRLKRTNAVNGFDGLDQISVIVIDALGNQFTQRVTLSNNYLDYEFDLAGQAGFAAAAVSKIILRQNYADIDLTNYQQERRGEIFVNIGNLDVPVKSTEIGFSRAFLTELPSGTRVNGRGFMSTGTVPGYITMFDENPSDEIRQFRYDVGGSDASVVHGEILPPQGETSFILPQSFVMALKNDGNGSKVNVRFTDSNNREKEFLVTLTNNFQNIYFNFEALTGGSGEFNYESVKKIAIEVTRKLSPERRGRVDFYLPLKQTDPFTQQKPVVNSATADAVGNSTVQFSTLTDAVIYQVQISRNANFTDIIHEGFPVNPPETVKINQSGTFHVRVRGSKNASVETGPVSQWSDTKPLVIARIVDAKPTISQITTSNLTGETQIDFTSVAGATIYHVQVATDANFTNIVHNGFPTGLLEKVNLGTNQTYFVRVKGSVDGNFVDGFTSQWATTQQFTRNVPNREFNPEAGLTHTNITSFPNGTAGALKVTSLGSGGNSTDSATATDRGVRVNFNTGTAAGNSGGFAGGGFTYDDFGTGALESGDLSGLTELILGVQGDSTRLKFEIIDALGHSSYVFLNNVSNTTEKFWRIPLSLFEGVDMTKVRIMYMIVEGHGKSGQLLINRLPDNVIPRDYNPDGTLNASNITLLPDGTAGAPKITSLGSGGNSSDSATAGDRGVLITYNTGTAAGGAGGFAGGGFTFDDFGTGPFETGNISGLTHLVFGVKGNSADLKLELVDKNGNSNFVRLHQVSSTTEQFYKIPTAAFSGVDLTQLRIIYFIVEGHGKSGQLEINRLPSNPRLIDPDPALTENDLNKDAAPDYEFFATSLGSGGNSQDDVELTDRGLIGTYNTGTSAGGSNGFAGAGFAFDDFGTTPIETADLTLVDEFIIGVKGNESQMKLEVVDGTGQSSFVHIRNISPTQEKFYRIPMSLFTSQIDITKVRVIYFIVEGHGKSGSFEVNVLPTPPIVTPSATLTPADIVDFTNGGITSGAVNTISIADPALGASAQIASNGRGVDIQFNTGAPGGFAGAGFSYDNFGTPAVESTDLTGVTLKVGFKGPALRVRMIVEDSLGNPDLIYLDGIVPSAEKVFEIPMSLFDEIDLTKVKNIFIIYEGDNLTGTLSFYNKKP